jgi:hypothetical protein
MRLAIADPPYPPIFSMRYDVAGGRVTMRSRATRWYGEGPGSTHVRADIHPEASRWDDLTEHRQLMQRLLDEFDGWAIATTPDGLGAYHPLPIGTEIGSWHKTNGMPGGGRIVHRWEPVIVYVPIERRHGNSGRVSDALVEAAPRRDFAGAKPHAWTRWVLDMLGYDPATDEVVDLFPGSGAVSEVI